MINNKGFTLQEIAIVVMLVSFLSLLAIKSYQGYINNQKADLIVTEMHEVKNKLQREMELKGLVLWSQLFKVNNWNPSSQSIQNVYKTLYPMEISYITGQPRCKIDCLVIKTTKIENTVAGAIEKRHTNPGKPLNDKCTTYIDNLNSYVECIFNE